MTIHVYMDLAAGIDPDLGEGIDRQALAEEFRAYDVYRQHPDYVRGWSDGMEDDHRGRDYWWRGYSSRYVRGYDDACEHIEAMIERRSYFDSV